jgi:hypothetical protein
LEISNCTRLYDLPGGFATAANQLGAIFVAVGVDPFPMFVFFRQLDALRVSQAGSGGEADALSGMLVSEWLSNLGERASHAEMSALHKGQLPAFLATDPVARLFSQHIDQFNLAAGVRRLARFNGTLPGILGRISGAPTGSGRPPAALLGGRPPPTPAKSLAKPPPPPPPRIEAYGGGGGWSTATPQVICSAAAVVSGSRVLGGKALFECTPRHYSLGGVSFLKSVIDAAILKCGANPSGINVSFLLCGPAVPGGTASAQALDVDFCLSWVTALSPALDVVLPHPDWFKDKMAKPALDVGACSVAIPKYFR